MRQLWVLLAALAVTLTASTPLSPSTADLEVFVPRDSITLIIERQSSDMLTLEGQRARFKAWNKLCLELREVDCTGVAAPRIKTFPRNPTRPGLSGFYRGGDIVYISNDLVGKSREEVLVHEMSHYLDQRLGLLPRMPVYTSDTEGLFKVCYSEKRAWQASDNYNISFGNPKRVVGRRWVNWYKHCTQFKDRLYPDNAPASD